jgi:hypothetical protein
MTAVRLSDRWLAALLALVAATLVLMSSLHLSGVVDEGSKPFDHVHAGVAEAVIALVLLGGAAALLLATRHARALATASLGFAIVGFVIGLTFTIRGGGAIDIAYHVTILPLLLLMLVLGRSARARRPAPRPR